MFVHFLTHDDRLESVIAIRKSTSTVKADTAKADAILIGRAENAAACEQAEINARKRGRWPPSVLSEYSWRENIYPDGTVILLPAEYKRKEAAKNINQLVYDLSTALCPRYAIGMEDAVIYGLTAAGGKLSVYAGRWLKDRV
jgi:hypothetical protein